MSTFREFKQKMQNHIKNMLSDEQHLYTVDVDKDVMWNLYLDSFPPGTNEIFRERRAYDCQCCKQFIRQFGNVVTIDKDFNVVTVWDFAIEGFQPVVNALSQFIKTHVVSDALITDQAKYGTDISHSQGKDGTVETWEHFYAELPKRFLDSTKTPGKVMSDLRAAKDVLSRTISEIPVDSIDTVLELIDQNSLYKGEEWKSQLQNLRNIITGKPDSASVNTYVWRKSREAGPVISKIRNHSIGTLLVDISEGMDLDQAVRRYEQIVAPTNYKRPKEIFTKRMLEQAQQKVMELGLMDSLPRRHAALKDITINNVLFADRDVIPKMQGDVFAELGSAVTTKPKDFSKVEAVTADTFITDILPKAEKLEVMFENRHISNLMSLIAPVNRDAPSILKWNNNFSWAYNGNITDSMKERVKAAGGRVDGVLRFSIQWNDIAENRDDLDAHCFGPTTHIYYANKGKPSHMGGGLDIDIIHPKTGVPAVENITWLDKNNMAPGDYIFKVHQFSDRNGKGGFRAQIEFDGEIHEFDCPDPKWHQSFVHVATVKLDQNGKFSIEPQLESSQSSRTEWNLSTNQFHQVHACMLSPNYWDAQQGIGHRHLLFMLKDCLNPDQPNGFFNEFLRQDLAEHKRVFEALGSKMKVEQSDRQLSGLGFSMTKRAEITVKITGKTSRVLRVTF